MEGTVKVKLQDFLELEKSKRTMMEEEANLRREILGLKECLKLHQEGLWYSLQMPNPSSVHPFRDFCNKYSIRTEKGSTETSISLIIAK